MSLSGGRDVAHMLSACRLRVDADSGWPCQAESEHRGADCDSGLAALPKNLADCWLAQQV